ncbi:LysR substrate-binding domain-containing protein [Haloechinothrix sp. LS1_15]|uniref:LysR family transcriptional regulator n=1 Tax=Haloechinothrix sp. LS1_15 TaxID=2652248 RepID=UPI002945AE90|nr:LysR substrate-binding domain-containing protein [Haloechinothrix sp. LS1_15]MDV6010948.1 LysR family transcriptional regulator [Haloechinothrix sp. LS1_15]
MFLRQLEYLVALDQQRHFGRAAESCWVSQPTLSDGIRKLEKEFGVAIVRRAHHFEGFTPEGERLLAWARQLLAERDNLAAELGSLRDGLSGKLRLGVIPTALPVLSMLTQPLHERHPLVRASILSLTSREIHRGLSRFELDAGLTYLSDTPPDLRAVPLYEERYLLLCRRDGPLAERASVTWEEAAAQPLCLLTPDMQNRRIIDAMFAEVNATPQVGIETNSVSTLCSHVSHAGWSTVIPHAWLRLLGTPPGTRVLRLAEPQPSSTVGVIVQQREPPPLLAGALLEVVTEIDVQQELDAMLR